MKLIDHNMLNIKIGSHQVKALVDTGASKSCISPTMVKKLKRHPTELLSGECHFLTAANGQKINILGRLELVINIKGLNIPYAFLIVENLPHELLLGVDFLKSAHARIDFTANNISFGDDLVVASLSAQKQTSDFLKTVTRVIIPPQTEVILPMAIPNSFKLQTSMIEPVTSVVDRKLIVARSIVEPLSKITNCKVLNPTNAPKSIKKGSILATISNISVAAICSEEPKTENKEQRTKSSKFIPQSVKIKTLRDLGIEFDATLLSKKDGDAICDLLYQNRDLFAQKLTDLPGTHLMQHHIDTGNSQPIRQRSYRHTPQHKQEIDKQITQMLEADIIRESDTPWQAPVILVKKKSGELRFCIDYRKLNAVTVPKYYPLPTFTEVSDRVSEDCPTIFSSLDLRSGYHQMWVAPDSQPKTGFVTHSGVYCYQRMPFGLINAPANFQELVSKVLRGLKHSLTYIDDVIIFSKDPEEHITHLQQVFDRFRAANLRLHPTKCRFALSRITYLGHVLSADGVSVDDNKIKVIQDFPTPKNARDVKSWLGLAGYYRRFVKGFAARSANLRALLQKAAPFVWTQIHQTEFLDMKNALTTPPLLAYPNMNKDFIVTTDACTAGLGFILSQHDSEGRERVIAYGGRGLRNSERFWSITELECLGILEATRTWHPYLAGRHFKVITDHVSLKYLQTLKMGAGRLQRWALLLQGYDFEVEYKPGSKMTAADALSRRDYPTHPESDNNDDDDNSLLMAIDRCVKVTTGNDTHYLDRDWKEITFDVNNNDNDRESESSKCELNTSVNSITDDVANGKYDLPQLQQECPDVQDMLTYLRLDSLPLDDKKARKILLEQEDFTIIEGVLYHLYHSRMKSKDKTVRVIEQVWLPRILRSSVIKAYHDDNAHLGILRLFETIKAKYFWHRMYSDIEEYVKTCIRCQQVKGPKPGHAQLQPLAVPEPLTVFHLDFLGPLPRSNGFKYVLVVVESTTLFPEIFATKTADANEVARILYEHIFCRYGTCKSIITDRGQCFRSQLVNALCKIMNVKQAFTSSFHAQTNSKCERFNSTILKTIKLYAEQQSDWSQILPAVAMSYRASYVTSLGCSPFFGLYAKDMNLAIDTAIMPEVKMTSDMSIYIADLVKKLELTQKILAENVEEAHRVTKTYYDRSAKPRSFDVADRCWLHDPTNKKGVSAKLKTRWLGPYLVVNRITDLLYRLRHCHTGKELPSLTHIDRMRRYNADRDAFFTRNPDPTRLTGSDETVVPPFVGTDPLTNIPGETATDTNMTDETETMTQMQNLDDTHTCENGSSASQPSPINRSHTGSQPTNTNSDTWYTVVKISKKRRMRGKNEFLVHWEDGTKEWIEQSNITPAALDVYYVQISKRKRLRGRPRRSV
jgi:predicted aspartyl protease